MFGKIADALSGLVGLVDNIHTSDEERLTLKSDLLAIQATVITTAVDAEKELTSSRAQIITAEASSSHWLTSTWRPITMLTFLAIVVAGQFGGTPVPPEMWPLLKLGLGGYVIGRSVEKTIPAVLSSLKSAELTR